MLSKIKAFFTGRGRDRTEREEIVERKASAEHFRDVVGVAWKFDFSVQVTVTVNGLEASVYVRGRDSQVMEAAYNLAAGEAIRWSAELSEIDEKERRGRPPEKKMIRKGYWDIDEEGSWYKIPDEYEK